MIYIHYAGFKTICLLCSYPRARNCLSVRGLFKKHCRTCIRLILYVEGWGGFKFQLRKALFILFFRFTVCQKLNGTKWKWNSMQTISQYDVGFTSAKWHTHTSTAKLLFCTFSHFLSAWYFRDCDVKVWRLVWCWREERVMTWHVSCQRLHAIVFAIPPWSLLFSCLYHPIWCTNPIRNVWWMWWPVLLWYKFLKLDIKYSRIVLPVLWQ